MLSKFISLVEQRCPVAQFCVWAGGVVETYAGSAAASAPASGGGGGGRDGGGGCGLVTRIRRFLAVWTAVTARVLKQLKAMKPNTAASELELGG